MMRPFVTNRIAVNLAKEIFNLRVNESSASIVKELNSFEARCFYIRGSLPLDRGRARREREFTLKVCKLEDFKNRGVVDELNDVLIHVHNHGIPCSVPQRTVAGGLYEMKELTATPVRTKDTEQPKNALYNCVVRLLSYIPGQTMRAIPCGLNTFYKVGCFAAEVDKVLKNFECSELKTRSLKWDLNNLPLATKVSHMIQDPHQKKLLHHVESLFQTEIHPKLDSLPTQCIHADMNETNLIFKNIPGSTTYNPCGLIDFDLMNYNCLVFEIAVSAAYMMTVHLENPVEAGAHAVAGYQLNNPLTTEESDLIFYLIQTRLYESVCYGSFVMQLYPENSEYLLYTVQRAWKVLDQLAKTNKDEFDERWKQLCTTGSSKCAAQF